MYSLDDFLHNYVGGLVNNISQYEVPNRNLAIDLDLNSKKRILHTLTEDILANDVLNHLVFNALNAISGVNGSWENILGNWNLDILGNLTFRSYDLKGISVIELEDNGKGINLDEVKKIADNGTIDIDPLDYDSREELLDLLFYPGFTTKGQFRGVGLDFAYTQLYTNYNGEISIKGTTFYSKDGLTTVGSHNGKNTGTILKLELPTSLPKDS
jgi:signal transduction histidine kinase